MPTYVYQAVCQENACKQCRDTFEVQQRMSDPALTVCPSCQAPVRRVVQPVGLSTGPSTKSLLSDKNIKRHGFTKLVNEGDGKFRKI